MGSHTLRRFGWILVTVVLVLSTTIVAQSSTRRIFVSALDRTGAPILDLTTSDLRVVEDGTERIITRLTRGIEPMRILVFADASSAVGGDLRYLRAALTAFFDALPGDHELALVSTGRHARVRVPPTSERQKVKAAAASFSQEGGQNTLAAALPDAYSRFVKTSPAWPVFVVLTIDQGELRQEQPLDSYNEFLQDFAARAGSAHAVVLRRRGSGPISVVASHLTESVGGMLESITDPNSLADRMKAVAERIGSDHRAMSMGYEVEYTVATNELSRNIQVLATRNGIKLHVSPRRRF